MGKTFSTANDYGNISIQLEHSKYTAGDQVNGWIYVSLMRNFPSNVLYLIITGKEKVRLVTVDATTAQANNMHNHNANLNHNNINNPANNPSYSQPFTNTNTNMNSNTSQHIGPGQSKHIHTDKNEFFAHTFPLFSMAGNFFPFGQYSFPFSFKLPDNLPGTFVDEWNEHGEKCFAKTTYKLWAGLKEEKGKLAVFSKQYFSVDQRFEHSTGAQLKSYQKELKGYCYKSLGELKMNCRFEKDKFFAGELALMHFEVDNSHSKSNIKKIKCQLIQNSRYGTAARQNIKYKSNVISSTEIPGILAGEARTGQNAFPLQLLIKTAAESQATSTHNLVNNSFVLSISTEMNDCLCCEAEPSTSIDVKVFNRPPSYYVPFQPAPGWNPQVMSPYVCTISNEYRMTNEFRNQVFNDNPNAGAYPNQPMNVNYPAYGG